MLAAEPAPLQGEPRTLTVETEIRLLDRDALVADEVLLNDVFGLLVLAHYRTTPGIYAFCSTARTCGSGGVLGCR